MMDRSEASRALAKAIAYKRAGNDLAAAQWAQALVDMLESAGMLS